MGSGLLQGVLTGSRIELEKHVCVQVLFMKTLAKEVAECNAEWKEYL